MSSPFAPRASEDRWFRLGRIDVTTTVLVVGVVVATWIAWVIAPSLVGQLYFSPVAVATGEPWRIITWPFANGLDFWAALNLFFFWYFGSDLESDIGRRRMAWLLLGCWAALTAAATAVGLLLSGGTGLAGFGFIQFVVLLVWIAENPRRRFLFNIPAWVFGLALLALQVLTLLAARSLDGIASLALSLVLVAMVARSQGLLHDLTWLPGRRSRVRSPRPTAPGRTRRRRRSTRRQASDAERLDALLDQINERGIHSLSPAQRRELMKLRERRKGQA